MKIKELAPEVAGWYGTIVVILAYIAVSFEWLSPVSASYQVVNATGAAGLLWISMKKKVYQPGILYLVWTIIALIALGKIFIQ